MGYRRWRQGWAENGSACGIRNLLRSLQLFLRSARRSPQWNQPGAVYFYESQLLPEYRTDFDSKSERLRTGLPFARALCDANRREPGAASDESCERLSFVSVLARLGSTLYQQHK